MSVGRRGAPLVAVSDHGPLVMLRVTGTLDGDGTASLARVLAATRSVDVVTVQVDLTAVVLDDLAPVHVLVDAAVVAGRRGAMLVVFVSPGPGAELLEVAAAPVDAFVVFHSRPDAPARSDDLVDDLTQPDDLLDHPA